MPELPEVEIVRRGLAPVLEGDTLVCVEQRRGDLRFPFPENFAGRLKGRQVQSIGRRAKYLLAHLDGDETLVMHLGMSGRFTVGNGNKGTAVPLGDYEHETCVDPKHDHVVFRTRRGAMVTYNDPRRFGFMLLVPGGKLESHALFANLGIEPLGNGLSAGYIGARAEGRKTDLKAFLMDQRNVAGLGNIYVCEALHRAGLSPKRKAASLAAKHGRPAARTEALVPAIRSVLNDALDAGGSTLRDYRKADGSQGAFQDSFSVYGRAGEKCLRAGCNGTVVRIVQSQRSTFYCPKCQR